MRSIANLADTVGYQAVLTRIAVLFVGLVAVDVIAAEGALARVMPETAAVQIAVPGARGLHARRHPRYLTRTESPDSVHRRLVAQAQMDRRSREASLLNEQGPGRGLYFSSGKGVRFTAVLPVLGEGMFYSATVEFDSSQTLDPGDTLIVRLVGPTEDLVNRDIRVIIEGVVPWNWSLKARIDRDREIVIAIPNRMQNATGIRLVPDLWIKTGDHDYLLDALRSIGEVYIDSVRFVPATRVAQPEATDRLPKAESIHRLDSRGAVELLFDTPQSALQGTLWRISVTSATPLSRRANIQDRQSVKVTARGASQKREIWGWYEKGVITVPIVDRLDGVERLRLAFTTVPARGAAITVGLPTSELLPATEPWARFTLQGSASLRLPQAQDVEAGATWRIPVIQTQAKSQAGRLRDRQSVQVVLHGLGRDLTTWGAYEQDAIRIPVTERLELVYGVDLQLSALPSWPQTVGIGVPILADMLRSGRRHMQPTGRLVALASRRAGFESRWFKNDIFSARVGFQESQLLNVGEQLRILLTGNYEHLVNKRLGVEIAKLQHSEVTLGADGVLTIPLKGWTHRVNDIEITVPHTFVTYEIANVVVVEVRILAAPSW